MRRLLSLLILFVGMLGAAFAAPNFEKQQLKVLYVGYRPDMPLPDFATIRRTEREQAGYETRMQSFKSMLENYFTDVQTVDARDYREEMSRQADVTIFDALPKPIKPGVVEIDPDFGSRYLKSSGVYLSKDFDSPALFVGYVADEIGHSLGLKLDWFCLCLRHHALNIRTEHPIFHEPFEVDITLEQRPTPDEVYNYTPNWVLPREIPMWRVQKDHSRIGMVAGWYGLEEGNDAEFISGGHNMKSYENMAIGRHANFFMWGFGAAPDCMTEEAKTVFANAVCYISQFAGEMPVVRRYGHPLMRGKIEDFMEVTTLEGYLAYLQGVMNHNEWLPKQQEKVKKMSHPTAKDSMWLHRELMKPLSHLDYVKKNSQFGLIAAYHDNIEAVHQFLSENMEYFYGSDSRKNDLEIDEDVKSLGISNRDVHLLDSCITMLEQGKDVEKAHRILERYTYQKFASAEEWRAWFTKYESSLFFTEVGNYKFMGDGSVCVDPESEAENSEEKQQGVKPDRNVNVTTEVRGNGMEKEVRIVLAIKEGFHIYADGGDDCPMIMTSLDLTLPQGVEKIGEMILPPSENYTDDVKVYKNTVVFVQKIKVIDPAFTQGEITCALEYQCCNADMCIPPQQETHKILLSK